MLQSLLEPKTRPQMGARPMALLILACGIAIGASLADMPARTVEPPVPVTSPSGDPTTAARRPVRVIPLPVREAAASRR